MAITPIATIVKCQGSNFLIKVLAVGGKISNAMSAINNNDIKLRIITPIPKIVFTVCNNAFGSIWVYYTCFYCLFVVLFFYMNIKLMRTLAVLVAVIVTVILIVVAPMQAKKAMLKKAAEQLPAQFETKTITTVLPTDHLLGSKDAAVTMVVYSDLDCPFCHKAHPILKDAVTKSDGKVAMVYRQFPLEGLHPDAFNKALITECVAKEKGNDAFWKVVDSYMIKKNTDEALATVGLTQKDIESCVNLKTHTDTLRAEMKNAAKKMNIQGTPYIIVIGPNNQQYEIPGAPQNGLLDVVISKMLATPTESSSVKK